MISKKTLAAAVIASSLTWNPVYAGIPTIDVVGNTMSLLNHIETILQMVDQVNRMKEQIETAKDTFETAKENFESFNGLRDMSGLLTSTSDRNYIAYNAGDLISLPTDGDIVAAEAERLQQSSIQIKRVYERASKRMEQLQELVAAVDTTDPKAAMDLQNRIQAEAVFMQNDLIKVQMMTAHLDTVKQQVAQAGREQSAQFGRGGSAVYADSF